MSEAPETASEPRAAVVRAWGESDPPAAGAERVTLGQRTDFPSLQQSVVALSEGDGPLTLATGDDELVLFILSGAGSLTHDGERRELRAESGVCLLAGEIAELRAAGEEGLRAVAVRIPDPAGPSDVVGERAVLRDLADQEAQAATGEREFRIVADPSSGLRSATHFVGYIPPGRAPVHFHYYDEVIYILDGEGAFHGGGQSTPISEGSCIQLPAKTLHTVENAGPEMMRLVAVFRPAGSPAAAYYPDGSPAYYAAALHNDQSAAGAGPADPNHAPEEE